MNLPWWILLLGALLAVAMMLTFFARSDLAKRFIEEGERREKKKKWREGLKAISSVSRLALIEELKVSGDPDAVEVLICALASKDRDMTAAIYAALSQKPGDWPKSGSCARGIADLAAFLGEPDPFLRQAVTRALSFSRFGAAGLPALLSRAMTDPHFAVREEAAQGLGEIQDPSAIMPLAELLHDRHEKVRAAAARALGEIGDPRAQAALAAALASDKEHLVKMWIEEALAKIELQPRKAGSAEAPTARFVAALKDERKAVRRVAAKTFWQLKDEGAIEPLVTALADQDIGYSARMGLDAINREWRSLPHVQAKIEQWHEQLRHPDPIGQVGALYSLKMVGQARLEAVLPLISASDWDTQVGAMNLLDESNRDWRDHDSTRDAVAGIAAIALNSSCKFSARYAAMTALGWVGGGEAVHTLLRIMKDRNHELATKARDALKVIREAGRGEKWPRAAASASEDGYAPTGSTLPMAGQQAGHRLHCLFPSGNQSVIASLYRVLRSGLPDAPAGRYRALSGTLLSRAGGDTPPVKYFGEAVLGMESKSLPGLEDALREIGHAGQDAVHLAYVSIDSDRLADLGITYNAVLEEAVKQGILPFRMIVTAVNEGAEFILNLLEPVEITDSLKKPLSGDVMAPAAGHLAPSSHSGAITAKVLNLPTLGQRSQ